MHQIVTSQTLQLFNVFKNNYNHSTLAYQQANVHLSHQTLKHSIGISL